MSDLSAHAKWYKAGTPSRGPLMRKDQQLPRREFLKTGAAATATFLILPSGLYGKQRRISPNGRVNIATIGCGGMGRANMVALASMNHVALCDVDWNFVDSRFAD